MCYTRPLDDSRVLTDEDGVDGRADAVGRRRTLLQVARRLAQFQLVRHIHQRPVHRLLEMLAPHVEHLVHIAHLHHQQRDERQAHDERQNEYGSFVH